MPHRSVLLGVKLLVLTWLAGPRADSSAAAGTDQNYIRQLSRRGFLKTGGVFVIGVSLGASVLGCGRENAPVAGAPDAAPAAATGPWSPDVFVSFDPDGTVHIISHPARWARAFISRKRLIEGGCTLFVFNLTPDLSVGGWLWTSSSNRESSSGSKTC